MKSIKIANKDVYKIVISLALMITVITGFYLYFINTDDVYLKKDLTCDFREKVYVGDFILAMEGKLLDNYLVDTSEVGLKDIIITYKNKYGFITGKKFTIEVKDVVSPTVVVSNPYTVERDSITNLEDEIFCADDYDDNISCKIIGEYDLKRVGKYNLEIVATDDSNNSTSKEFVLNVIEKQVISNQMGPKRYTRFETIYNRYKSDNTEIGLDISKWQGEVDYKKIKSQGVEFVMLKIGGQTEIGGEFKIDPMFYENIEGALDNGIKVGVYFYSYAKSEKEAIKQADWIITKLEDYEITLPIVFDWENWNGYSKFHISFHTLNKIAASFIERVVEKGYQGVLYSSKYYLENIWYEDDYTNWVAYYTDSFDNYKDYYMWQVCSDGKIAGIDGYVDIDVMYKGEENT